MLLIKKELKLLKINGELKISQNLDIPKVCDCGKIKFEKVFEQVS